MQYHLSHPVHVMVRGEESCGRRGGVEGDFHREGEMKDSQVLEKYDFVERTEWHSYSTVRSSWLSCEIPWVKGREEIPRGDFSRTAVLRKAWCVASYLHF